MAPMPPNPRNRRSFQPVTGPVTSKSKLPPGAVRSTIMSNGGNPLVSKRSGAAPAGRKYASRARRQAADARSIS